MLMFMKGKGAAPAAQSRADTAYAAGKAICDMAIAYYQNERGVHAETVIGALAALFGEWTLRATDAPLPAEGWVMSEDATDIMLGGLDPLWGVVSVFAERAGVGEAEMPDSQDTIARTVAAIGRRYPALSVPEKHFPLEWSPVAAPRFRERVQQIADAHELSGREIAAACAMATGLAISMTKDVVDPRITLRLSQEIAFGVARMAPLPGVNPQFTPYRHAA